MTRRKLISNPAVNYAGYLYHGTTLSRLKMIIKDRRIRPSKEHGKGKRWKTPSPHGIFLVEDAYPAWAYASGAWASDGGTPVILKIDVTGLDLLPDLDDAGMLINIDLEEFNKELQEKAAEAGLEVHRNFNIGEEVPEQLLDIAADVVESLQNMIEDREPFTIAVEGNYVVAEPFVLFPVTSDFRKNEDLEDDVFNDGNLTWQEGEPYFLTRQFMTTESILVSRIAKVFKLPMLFQTRREKLTFTKYDELNDDESAFKEVTLVGFDLKDFINKI